jgi:hypothetical protein
LDHPQRLRFLGFLCLKPDNDYRVINKVINVRQAKFSFSQ